jgi:guanine nucleotide-binding protein alpha-1 subunit
MVRPADDNDPLTLALRPPPDEPEDARQLRIQREQEAKRVSMIIDEQIRQERLTNKHKKIVRVLLLGQSESGAPPSPLFLFI